MKQILHTYDSILRKVPLFQGLHEDLPMLLSCLEPRVRSYPKGAPLFLVGDKMAYIGVVLEGAVTVQREHINGSSTILSHVGTGDIFGEAFVCAGETFSKVSVQALEETVVLYLDYQRILSVCAATCVFHTKLIENMIALIAKKNLALVDKMEVLSQPTIREKLLTYLEQQSARQQNTQFTIPYNREQLADYLCVNRSALSRELSAMQDEGLVSFYRSDFQLH